MDPETGEDLNPINWMLVGREVRDENSSRNPDRPSNLSSLMKEEGGPSRGSTRMTSPEKWELKQLIAAGVLQKSDYPGML